MGLEMGVRDRTGTGGGATGDGSGDKVGAVVWDGTGDGVKLVILSSISNIVFCFAINEL